MRIRRLSGQAVVAGGLAAALVARAEIASRPQSTLNILRYGVATPFGTVMRAVIRRVSQQFTHRRRLPNQSIPTRPATDAMSFGES